jgi:hypothetical protein
VCGQLLTCPDGRYIISGSGDRAVHKWDSFPRNSDPIYFLGYSGWTARPRGLGQRRSPRLTPLGTPRLSRRPPPTCPPHCRKRKDRPDRESNPGHPYFMKGVLTTALPSRFVEESSTPTLTILLTSAVRSTSLRFDEFTFGTSWTHIYKTARS